ncbi:LacI family transcriptional regulator [Opitutaceae bacterium TAV4]|nr:LacI family transcriptional regulator [Opitutaceae bacterium TAV4]RRK01812.1 LacI family transcriptional regulator [Opitutaceae bacterium TAV3]
MPKVFENSGSERPKRITLSTIAEHLGVTANTVSAALRGTGKISRDKRAEIKKVAAEWGYQPHMGAQLLRLKNMRRVGLLITAGTEEAIVAFGFQFPIVKMFTIECQRRKLRYQVEWCGAGQTIPNLVSEGMTSGLLVAGRMESALNRWLQENCPIPHVPLAEPGAYAVLPDAAGNQQKVMKFLTELGHRRIALMGGPGAVSTFHTESTQAFIDEAKAAQVDTQDGRWIVCHDDPHPTSNRQPLEAQLYAMLRKTPRPTAVICMGLYLAQVVLVAALRAGIAVPYELSIIVHTTEQMAAEAYPRFSVLDPDSEAMAAKGLERLTGLLDGREAIISDTSTVRVPGRLISYDTTTIAPAS